MCRRDMYMFNFRVQNSGLGGLRHNTVMLGWPYGWRHNVDERSYKVFLGWYSLSNPLPLADTF